MPYCEFMVYLVIHIHCSYPELIYLLFKFYFEYPFIHDILSCSYTLAEQTRCSYLLYHEPIAVKPESSQRDKGKGKLKS